MVRIEDGNQLKLLLARILSVFIVQEVFARS